MIDANEPVVSAEELDAAIKQADSQAAMLRRGEDIGNASSQDSEQGLNPEPLQPSESTVKIIKAHEKIDDLSGDAEWYIDKNTKGNGPRPEWLQEGVTLEDQAKRAHGLRQQVSRIKHAPEEYSINVDPVIAEFFDIKSDDPLLEEYKLLGLEHDVSQEAFDAFLNKNLDIQAGEVLKQIENNQAEFKEYGIDPDDTFEQVTNWIKNNLGEDDKNLVNDKILTAPQLYLMKKIINKFAGLDNMPTDFAQAEPMSETEKSERLQAAMRDGFSLNEVLMDLFPDLKSYQG